MLLYFHPLSGPSCAAPLLLLKEEAHAMPNRATSCRPGNVERCERFFQTNPLWRPNHKTKRPLTPRETNPIRPSCPARLLVGQAIAIRRLPVRRPQTTVTSCHSDRMPRARWTVFRAQ
jgi:hypothetical protein